MITREDMYDFMEEMQKEVKAQRQDITSMVREFATVMNQKPDPAMSGDLIYEEFKEWQEACACAPLDAEGDKAELKELADLVYVIYGYANVLGWDLDEAIRRVHKNNLERCIQPDGSVKYREDGKVMKRENPPKVDLSDLV